MNKTPQQSKERAALREVVLEALVSLGHPVGSKEILAYIRQHGYQILNGRTPRASIQAAVWKDIQQRKSASRFRMLGSGRNNRKFWLSETARKQLRVGESKK